MKYIMLQTTDGQKLPVIFPEALVHVHVAAVMTRMVERSFNRPAAVVSAGFVTFGDKVKVHGESESLDNLKSNPLDAMRIVSGASVAHMPDAVLEPLARKLGFVE